MHFIKQTTFNAGKDDVSSQLIRVHITNLLRKLLEAGAEVNVVGQKGSGYELFNQITEIQEPQ